MDPTPMIEAIYLAAADPATASRFYTQGMGLGEPTITADGQYTFSGAGTFFAIEPLSDAVGAADGQVTVWYRVDDVSRMLNRLISHGASVLQPPTGAGDEVVAVVLAPNHQRIGFIGSAPTASTER
jgi:predicted enzyme related to lactoylglutathione lyase